MSGSPKVSILLPVRNAAAYLREAIDSISQQSFSEWECFAVDDGSTDASRAILEAWSGRDARVRVLSGDGSGIVTALNLAASEARGEYLARMDGDDVCHPSRLEMQVSYMRSHPECVALGTAVLWIDHKGRLLGRGVTPVDHTAIWAELRKGNGAAITHPSLLMRRTSFDQVGGYRSTFRHVEDFDLYWRLVAVGQLANLPQPLLKYRQHAGSVNHHRHDLQLQLKGKVLQEQGIEISLENPLAVEKKTYSLADGYANWSHKAMTNGHFSVGLRYACKAWLADPFTPARLAASLRLIRLGCSLRSSCVDKNSSEGWS